MGGSGAGHRHWDVCGQRRGTCGEHAEGYWSAEGVFIEQLDLSGMTISEAIDAVDDCVAGKTASKIRLTINDNWVEVTAGDMGLSCGNAEVVRGSL